MLNVLRLARWSIERYGVRGTLRLVPSYAARLIYVANERWEGFDRRHGTDTSAAMDVMNMGIAPEASAGALMYQGCSPEALRQAVGCAGIDPREFSFVDFGAGKGRALIVAWELGFRRIIGVELSPKLAAIANANVALLKPIPPIEVHTSDARDLAIPEGNLVAFFFNPFHASVMQTVLERIEAAFRQGAGELVIVYENDTCAHLMDQAPWLERIAREERPGLRRGSFAVYRGVRPSA